MKKISKITRKGQITLPMVVREELGVTYGEKVEFTKNEKGEIVLKPIKTDLEGIYGALQDRKADGTLEEQCELGRNWAVEKRQSQE